MTTYTREADSELSTKGDCLFSSMVDITVGPNGVVKLFGRLNVLKAAGTDRLNAKVLKE